MRSWSNRQSVWFGAAALVLAGALAYSNSFQGIFVFDDLLSIPRNPTIRQLWPITRALHPPGFGTTVDSRPVLNVSLAFNYALSGTDVWSYHLVNLIIHILAAWTVFGVLRRTGLALARGESAVTALALAIALVWEVHPLQTESVTYIVQRAESLMSLCYLLTLYGFIRACASAGRRAAAWRAFSWLACLVGMGVKEVMVSAPVIVLAYDSLLGSGSWRAALRRRPGYYLALAATWLPLAMLVRHAGNRGGKSGPGSVPFLQYWLTQPPAIAHYLRLTFWPEPQILDYGATWVKSAATALPGLLLIALIVGATAYALTRPARTVAAAAGFMGLWFLAMLAPTSLVPGNRQTLSEHRMYLALVPVLTATVVALSGALRRWAGSWSRSALIVGCGLALPGVLLTLRRNRDYFSDWAIFGHDARASPDNPYALVNYGDVFLRANRGAEAIAYLDKAIQLGLDTPIMEHNYGVALMGLRRPQEAARHFEAAIRMTPAADRPQDFLALDLVNLGRVEEGVRETEALLRRFPVALESQVIMARTLIKDHDYAAAFAIYDAMTRVYPDLPEVQIDVGNALTEAGRRAEAIEHYRTAIRLRPDYAEAHYNLGQSLLASGQPLAGIAEIREAISERPDFVVAHYNLGRALLLRGEARAAQAEFEAALRLAPNESQSRHGLADALRDQGRLDEAIAQYRAVLKSDPDDGSARRALSALGAEF
jgi:tetratricopeptide (TPR) repeat protein